MFVPTTDYPNKAIAQAQMKLRKMISILFEKKIDRKANLNLHIYIFVFHF